jgi:exopolysaccharide production protein ExoZ
MMVVYLHMGESAHGVTGSIGIIPHSLVVVGRAGVDIFFVLSGVVIAKTAPGMTPENFLWRRVRRILPIYYVATLLLIAIANHDMNWRVLLSTFLLWPATDVMVAPLLPVAWSLAFEMLFYLSATLVLLDRRWLWALGGCYVLAFSLRSFSPVFQFLGNPIIIEFLFGVVISQLPGRRWAIWGIPVGFAALIAAGPLGLWPQGLALEFLIGQDSLQRVFVYGLPSALIVYGVMQIKAGESVWSYLGDASYSIYLFHTFVVILMFAFPPFRPELLVLVGMAVSVFFAWRIHELIEKPILRAIPTLKDRSREVRSPTAASFIRADD